MNSDKLIYAVDDEESIREVYRFALSGAGFEPRCFSCWEELSAALKSELPRLIILDIMLDGADGYEILKKLRDNATTAEIP